MEKEIDSQTTKKRTHCPDCAKGFENHEYFCTEGEKCIRKNKAMTTQTTAPSLDPSLALAKKLRKKKLKIYRDPWEKVKGSVKNLPLKRTYTVSTIVDDWFQSSHFRNLTPRTKRTYMSLLRLTENLVLAGGKPLTKMLVHQVTYPVVDYIRCVLQHHVSQSTLRSVFVVLSLIWDHALKGSKVAINPWLRQKIKVNNERDVTWSPETLKMLLDGAEQFGFQLLKTYVILMYETGQRPWLDIRDLKWSNYVVLDDGRKAIDFTISKTGVHVILPLSNDAIKAIEKQPRINEYIMVNEKGQRPTSSNMGAQFNIIKKQCGIPSNLLMRDIRRTVITEMAMAGATREQIRAVTGWKSDVVILRYARTRLNSASGGMDKLWGMRDKNKKMDVTIVEEDDAQLELFKEK